ncbi:hypothetical protein MMC34_004136 [Xylographa carneopallida]|nr:hypothetical protein [Xylographa carneopallida]
MSGNGAIEDAAVTQLSNFGMLACPDCGEPSRDTKRYEFANQLQDLTITMEHFHSKFGRKLSELHKDYAHMEQLLCYTFQGFCKSLKAGPLGGQHNRRAIWDRCNTTREIQHKAIQFRDEIVVPFENDIIRLAKFVKNTHILENVVSPFGLRYDLVYSQCRLITLEDMLQIYQYLIMIKPTDHHTSIVAEGLRIMIQENSGGEVLSLGRKITASKDLHLKRIEVELRIIQISHHMILKKLNITSRVDVSASLSSIRELVLTFPDTAGKLLRTFTSLRTHVNNGTIPARIAELYTKETKALGPLFKEHKMGTLRHCAHKHPFSESTFADCPECGKEVALPTRQPEVDAHKVLDPQAFINYFKAKGMIKT